jgi:hypothetical protein
MKRFRTVQEFFKRAGNRPDGSGRYCLWRTGTVGIYGFTADSPALLEELRKPPELRSPTAVNPHVFGPRRNAEKKGDTSPSANEY